MREKIYKSQNVRGHQYERHCIAKRHPLPQYDIENKGWKTYISTMGFFDGNRANDPKLNHFKKTIVTTQCPTCYSNISVLNNHFKETKFKCDNCGAIFKVYFSSVPVIV